MKTVVRNLGLVLLIIACAVDYVSAQRGEGRGFGGGFRGGNQADVISDSLVLNTERAEKVEAIVEAVQEDMRQPGGNFQDMSREERMEAFTAMREKMQTALVEKLAAVLSEKEIEAVKPLLSGFRTRTVAEIRALRQINLEDEQRSKLQEPVLGYMNTVSEIRPAFIGGGRGQGGPDGGQGGRGPGMSQDDQAKMDKALETLVSHVQGVLTEDQNKEWKVQIGKVEAELESQRQNRGQGRRGE